jgi:hypothetical protein
VGRSLRNREPRLAKLNQPDTPHSLTLPSVSALNSCPPVPKSTSIIHSQLNSKAISTTAISIFLQCLAQRIHVSSNQRLHDPPIIATIQEPFTSLSRVLLAPLLASRWLSCSLTLVAASPSRLVSLRASLHLLSVVNL